MKKFFAGAVVWSALLFLLMAAASAQAPKLTVQEALSAATALRSLDGRMVIVKKDGVDGAIMIPWEFGSGALRMKIAANLTILARVERDAEDARQKLVAEGLHKMPEGSTTIAPGTPEFVEFQKQYVAMMLTPATGVSELQRIKVSELKLDRNEIAGTVIQALGPILDAGN